MRSHISDSVRPLSASVLGLIGGGTAVTVRRGSTISPRHFSCDSCVGSPKISLKRFAEGDDGGTFNVLPELRPDAELLSIIRLILPTQIREARCGPSEQA